MKKEKNVPVAEKAGPRVVRGVMVVVVGFKVVVGVMVVIGTNVVVVGFVVVVGIIVVIDAGNVLVGASDDNVWGVVLLLY